MATLRERKIKNKKYYYIEHTYREGDKTKIISKYLGTKRPDNIDDIKKNIEINSLKNVYFKKFKILKKSYNDDVNKLPKVATLKFLEDFAINFTYNSNKIEGSTLSYKNTSDLLVHGITPNNKPLKDVEEAEGHRKAFFDMINFKEKLTLQKIREWHKLIFIKSDPIIAGKIRLHKIIVSGSRVSFPHPEDLNKELSGFMKWYNINVNKINPVEFSSLVHFKFVTIHPLSDGNGRISRILCNYILHKNDFPLYNIKFKDRKSYYKALEKSQLWRNEYFFIRFFFKNYLKNHKNTFKMNF